MPVNRVFQVFILIAAMIVTSACVLFTMVLSRINTPDEVGNPPLEGELLPLNMITPTQQMIAITIVAPDSPDGDFGVQSPIFWLEGIVFFDLDGNGLQGENEPGVQNALVCLESESSGDCTLTSQDGAYHLETRQPGLRRLRVNSPAVDPSSAFRYVSMPGESMEVQSYSINGEQVPKQKLSKSGVMSIDNSLEVDLNLVQRLDVGLMQGYLTDPFACEDRPLIANFHGFDLDPEIGSVRNYLGETQRGYGSEGKGTIDGHAALDWGSVRSRVIGTPVHAAAPGIVTFAGEDFTSHGACRMVTLVHPETGHKTGYIHLDKILVSDGQRVLRGQVLGTLGKSCTDWPHLHFTFNPGWKPGVFDGSNRDPFRDTQNADSVTWWTRDNEPICGEW